MFMYYFFLLAIAGILEYIDICVHLICGYILLNFQECKSFRGDSFEFSESNNLVPSFLILYLSFMFHVLLHHPALLKQC